MKRLYLLTLCSVIAATCIFLCKRREATTVVSGLAVPKQWLTINKEPVTPLADRRPPDQTFLTYPEWFLVFSPQEQAGYFKHTTATSFPFNRHTAQIWQSYGAVKEQINDNFPPNTGYHFMIWVIGSSATVEYTLKSWYETVVGRLTDTRQTLTAEDLFNADFTRDYVAFIKDRPWYEFDFKSQMSRLWNDTDVLGAYPLRKLERRYLLTTELLVKYAYGKLIGLGTQQVYGAALPTTAVILENDSLRYLPRYQQFATAAMQLAKDGHRFKEIAGNNAAILLTVIVPAGHEFRLNGATTLFVQPVAAAPQTKRVALVALVPQLHEVLMQLHREAVTVEHVFDF